MRQLLQLRRLLPLLLLPLLLQLLLLRLPLQLQPLPPRRWQRRWQLLLPPVQVLPLPSWPIRGTSAAGTTSAGVRLGVQVLQLLLRRGLQLLAVP